ncbi:MAG: hypothetical protein ABI729_04220 [Chitinophagales bacterium]
MSIYDGWQAERHSAWIIDTDHLAEPGDRDDAGRIGPDDAPADLVRRLRLKSQPGQTFRLYDDDGELYYTGRVLFEPRDGEPVTIETADEEDAFGPLWDFGTPNAGAVDLRYFGTSRDGRRGWQSL